jgi:hypothetical protein
MMDTDRFNLNDWIVIYELLDDDGHLSVIGKEELDRLRKR